MKYLDDTWQRKEHFRFFQSRENPRISVSFKVNIDKLYIFKCAHNFRFSDCIYFAALSAANGVDGFRQRIVDLRPVEFDNIDAAFTYIPKNRKFHCNCVAKFNKDFYFFSSNISDARSLADSEPTLYPEGGNVQSLVYLSCLPDIPILSATNPWGNPWIDSVPRFLFGKKESSGEITIAIEALHSFIDGIHLRDFFIFFEEILNAPERFFL